MKRCACGNLYSSDNRGRRPLNGQITQSCPECRGKQFNRCPTCGSLHKTRVCPECAGIPKHISGPISKADNVFEIRKAIIEITARGGKCMVCGKKSCDCKSIMKPHVGRCLRNLKARSAAQGARISTKNGGIEQDALDDAMLIQACGFVEKMARDGWYVDAKIPFEYIAAGLYELACLPDHLMRKMRRRHHRDMLLCLKYAGKIIIKTVA